MFLAGKLAFRSFARRRRSLARFTAMIAIAGLSAGVAGLILALAVARGFRQETQDRILAGIPHITVFLPRDIDRAAMDDLSTRIAGLGNVRSVRKTVYDPAVLRERDEIFPATIRAFETEQATDTSGLPKIEIGSRLADRLSKTIGDELEIFVLSQGELVTAKTRIAGLFETGIFEFDSSWIRVSISDLARIYGREDLEPHVLTVTVDDIYGSRKTAESIRSIGAPGLQVIDWQEANRPLFAALDLEGRLAIAMIGLIVLIAALNIVATLALLVNERRVEIAILRTCGARSSTLIASFVIEGLSLGAAGTLLGVCIGLTAYSAINYFQLIRLDVSVYSIEAFSLKTSCMDVLMIAVAAILISAAATIFPSLNAARIKPADNLRVE